MALSIEAAPEVRPHVCADCGRSFSSVHGFLYEDGDPHAVYHATLQSDHPSTVVDMALSFGSWAEDAAAADRIRVGVRVWPAGNEFKLHINDPSESAWGDSETFGRMVERRELLGTPLERDALNVAEFVVAHDSRVAGHLRQV
jgi:hypothetical protein